jgi:[ribosomal protein S5]-alanine N-acetyltransferase
MPTIAETERLYLFDSIAPNGEALFEINKNFEVIKFTGDEPFKSIEEANRFLNNYNHFKKYDFGRFGVFLKNSNEYIGWCGLKFSPELNEVDLGFRFYQNHWNKGYATEASKACLKLGFEKFNLTQIVGRVQSENLASIKVLEKIGMKFKTKINSAGLFWKIYCKSA